MTRAETVVIVTHLLNYYPFNKAEKDRLVSMIYGAYKDYNREAVTYLANKHLEKKEQYFPTAEELEAIRLEEIRQAEQILNDPRNPYYMQVSPEAGRRRQQKLDRAQNVIKLLRPQRGLLKE